MPYFYGRSIKNELWTKMSALKALYTLESGGGGGGGALVDG